MLHLHITAYTRNVSTHTLKNCLLEQSDDEKDEPYGQSNKELNLLEKKNQNTFWTFFHFIFLSDCFYFFCLLLHSIPSFSTVNSKCLVFIFHRLFTISTFMVDLRAHTHTQRKAAVFSSFSFILFIFAICILLFQFLFYPLFLPTNRIPAFAVFLQCQSLVFLLFLLFF